MRIKNFLLILFLGFYGNAKSQHLEEKIPWEEGVSLTWNDFKAKSPENSKFKANTNTGITYSWGLKIDNANKALKYEVNSYFYPHLSWIEQGSKNAHLLQHEQTHFDITELHARKLRKELFEIDSNELNQDTRKILNDLYKTVENERSLMQKEYDRVTNHSLNKDPEVKWQKIVREELFKLRNFRD
ncbi:MAG: DUF922 domain-containing protein [Bacteroidota bacterium]